MATKISQQHNDNWLRQSGLVLLISGLLTALGALLHPDEGAHPEHIVSTLWIVVHSGFMVATILMLFGLFGLHGKQAAATGFWGRLGFVLTFIGTILFICVFFFETLVMPTLTAYEGALDSLFNGPMGLVLLLTAIIFSIGTIVLGITTYRAAILSPWAGLLLVVAGPLTGFAGLLPYLVSMAGIFLLGLTLTWLGFDLWRDQPQAQVAVQGATA